MNKGKVVADWGTTGTTSNAVKLPASDTIVGFLPATGFSGTSLTLQANVDVSEGYVAVTGPVWTVAAGEITPVDPVDTIGINDFKIVSSASETAGTDYVTVITARVS